MISISTYGCNPLLMLMKLADAGALEIINSTKVSKWGNDYYSRVVAKVSNTLYIEAIDPLNEIVGADPANRFICGFDTTSAETPLDLTLNRDEQELSASSWAPPSCNLDSATVLTGISTPNAPAMMLPNTLEIPVMAVSYLIGFTKYTASGSPVVGYGASNLFYSYGTSAYLHTLFSAVGGTRGGFRLSEQAGGSRAVLVSYGTGYTPSASGNWATGTYSMLFSGGVRTPFTVHPPFIRGSDTSRYTITDSVIGFYVPFWNSPAYHKTHTLMLSGAVLRMASSVNGEGNLVTPSNWLEFPIHSHAWAIDGEGLVFANPENNATHANNFSTYLFVGELDTTKGNNFGEGKCPVMGRLNRTSVASGVAMEEASASISVLGTSSPNVGEKQMDLYSSAPPINSDSFSGGPIVSNVFAYDSEEIRGTIPPFLSCNTSLGMGTSGWLDGKRYRVIRPGLMMRVG